MLKKKIIPCLDVRDGRVVKGVKFLDVNDVGDPVERAMEYNRQGADELVLYDITAYNEGKRVVLDLIRAIKDNIFVPLTVAGGIKSVDDFKDVIDAGADKVSINSAAINNPQLIKEAAGIFGSERVMVGIDAKRNKNGDFVVAIKGGQIETDWLLYDWVREIERLGAGEICLNSIDADGVKTGYDIEMLNLVCENVSVPIIASGGCGKLEHFSDVFEKTGASSALAASVFHFNELTVGKVKEYLTEKNII